MSPTRNTVRDGIGLNGGLRASPSELVLDLYAGLGASQPNSIFGDGACRIDPGTLATVELPVQIHPRDEHACAAGPERKTAVLVRRDIAIPRKWCRPGRWGRAERTVRRLLPDAKGGFANDALPVVFHQPVGRQDPRPPSTYRDRLHRRGIRKGELIEGVRKSGNRATGTLRLGCRRRGR